MGHVRHYQERARRGDRTRAQPRPIATTPLQRHRLQRANAQDALAGNPEPSQRDRGRAAALGRAKSVHEQFAADVESLHGLTLNQKRERKTELVKGYRRHVEGLLKAGIEREALFTWWIVWLFDIGKIEEFIPKARQAVGLGWRTAFKSDLQTFMWDCVLAWAEGEIKARRGAEPYFSRVYPADLAGMHEIVQAKYHKLAGRIALTAANEARGAKAREAALTVALGCFEAADTAYDKAGVKTRIHETRKALERMGVSLENISPPPAASGSEAAQPSGDGPAAANPEPPPGLAAPGEDHGSDRDSAAPARDGGGGDSGQAPDLGACGGAAADGGREAGSAQQGGGRSDGKSARSGKGGAGGGRKRRARGGAGKGGASKAAKPKKRKT